MDNDPKIRGTAERRLHDVMYIMMDWTLGLAYKMECGPCLPLIRLLVSRGSNGFGNRDIDLHIVTCFGRVGALGPVVLVDASLNALL